MPKGTIHKNGKGQNGQPEALNGAVNGQSNRSTETNGVTSRKNSGKPQVVTQVKFLEFVSETQERLLDLQRQLIDMLSVRLEQYEGEADEYEADEVADVDEIDPPTDEPKPKNGRRGKRAATQTARELNLHNAQPLLIEVEADPEPSPDAKPDEQSIDKFFAKC